LTRFLIEQGYLGENELKEMKEEVKRAVESAAQWAENQPLPDPSTVLQHVYGIHMQLHERNSSNRNIPETKL